MILWFLRLFSEFRAVEQIHLFCLKLQTELQSEKDRASALESEIAANRDTMDRDHRYIETLKDRLEASMADRDQLWLTVQQALAGERTAYQSSINLQWQRQGMGIPYSESPHAERPLVEQEQNTIPRRRIASEVVAEATQRFVRDMTSRITQTA